MTTKKMKVYACANFPKYATMRALQTLKDDLLRETGGGEAFVARAAKAIRLHVLSTVPYRGPSAEFLHKLHRLGYDDEALARALARAWLDDVDHFMLPRVRKRDQIRTTKSLLAISLALALVTTIAMLLTLRHVYPEWAEGLLAFPPLMGMMGMGIAAAVFWILIKLFSNKIKGAKN